MEVKIKILISIFFTITVSIGCSDKRDDIKNEFNTGLLGGNWKTENLSDGLWENSLWLSFEDSTCSYLLPNSAKSNYRIDGHDLILDSTLDHPELRFEILSLDKANLTLVPKGELKKELIGFFEKYKQPELLKRIGGREPSKIDTLFFKRVQKKNELSFTSISLFTGACNGGECKPFILEIKKDRTVHLFDLEQHKGYRGEVSGCIMERLNSLVQNIPINKLKNRYEAPWTDDQEISLKIESAGKTINTVVYGFFNEPIELRALMEELESIKFLKNLRESDDIKRENFVFDQIPANVEESMN